MDIYIWCMITVAPCYTELVIPENWLLRTGLDVFCYTPQNFIGYTGHMSNPYRTGNLKTKKINTYKIN